jgi:hypothetical protein
MHQVFLNLQLIGAFRDVEVFQVKNLEKRVALLAIR